MKKIAIVTPVGNEINAISDFYDGIISFLASYPIVSAQWFVIFDSYSVDGSKEYIDNRKSDYVKVIDIGPAKGLTTAYLEGFRAALSWGAQKIIEMDVGHPILLLSEFVNTLDDFPIVYGTRYGEGTYSGPLFRKMISILGNLLSLCLLGTLCSDCTSGFQGFRNDVLRKVIEKEFISRGHMYQTEMKYYCKYIPFAEIPFDYVSSESSLRVREIVDAVICLIRLRYIDPIGGNYGS